MTDGGNNVREGETLRDGGVSSSVGAEAVPPGIWNTRLTLVVARFKITFDDTACRVSAEILILVSTAAIKSM